MKRVVILLIVVLLFSTLASAQADTVITVPAVRLPAAVTTAQGGLHAAVPGSFDAFFTNPGGFVLEQSSWGIGNVTINLSGPVFDLLGLLPGLIEGSAELTTILPALMDSNGRLYAAADIAGPLAFGFVGNGLGFGFFNRTLVEVNVSSLLFAGLTVREELLFAGGYARKFSLGSGQTVEIGIMPKGFVRAEMVASGNLLEIAALLEAPESLMSAHPFSMISGAGVDVGLTWRYDSRLALALVCRDAFTPALKTTYSSLEAFLDGSAADTKVSQAALVPADLSVGFYQVINSRLLTRLGVKWEWMADYKDIFNLFKPVPRHVLLNLGIGTRLTFLDIVQISFGINDTLPSFGFELDLKATKVSVSMYGRELGLDPGVRPVYNLLVGLSFVY